MSLEPGPEVPGAPVTAYNWQDPPFNRWAFWHVGEILPTYPVSRGEGPARALPAAAAGPDLSGVAISRLDGSVSALEDVLAGTFTDAYAVLQDGELVTEWYGPLGAPDRPHALMSVSKSVLGCVAAVLIDRGQLDPQAPVTAYVPELGASGYAGATVRHVLDMRSGVAFLEEYSNPRSDIRRLDEWIGWDGPSAQRASRVVPFPGHAAGRGAARKPVPVPLGGIGRAGVGVRARSRPARGRADLRAGVGADGRRARGPPAPRRAGHRRARRGPVRHRP